MTLNFTFSLDKLYDPNSVFHTFPSQVRTRIITEYQKYCQPKTIEFEIEFEMEFPSNPICLLIKIIDVQGNQEWFRRYMLQLAASEPPSGAI
jgi:hypothetical protein